jgi:Xaa-Pro dipeptidase
LSKHDFTPAEFAGRRAVLRAALSEAGLDWLVIFHPVSIHWLTGSDAKSYQEFQCLVIGAAPGPLTILTREGERNEFRDDALVDAIESYGGNEDDDPIPFFARLVDRLGVAKGRVGIEVPAYYLHPLHYQRVKALLGTALVAEPTNLVHDLKLVKSPAELGYIREASRIGDHAMTVFATALRAGESELALAGKVYGALLGAGSGIAASTLNLVSGERSCFSHGAPTHRLLRDGDTGNIEYGATFKRYTSTIGRQFNLGAPRARVREIYNVVRRAADAQIATIRDGVAAMDAHAAAKRIIAAAGLEHGRVHTSGYGLAPGFPPSWGEPLHMLADSRYVLRAGMVVTIEPPVFLGDERIGVRIIDNVVVTQDGTELLSRFAREIIVV